jgi:ribosomal protein S21
MEVRKRSNETTGALIYRFTRRTKQSGILREARKRRFRTRPESKVKARLSALHKAQKRKQYERAKKLGNA